MATRSVETTARGLGALVRWATATPMRKYGASFGVGGFLLGYASGTSGVGFEPILAGATVLGLVLADSQEKKPEGAQADPLK